MKYAVISDIHANLEALTVAISHIKKQKVDKIVCCGDLVGYYANPNECINILEDNNVVSIAGNHDLAAVDINNNLSSFWEVARNAILWTRNALISNSLSILINLPKTLVVDDKFILFHGCLHLNQDAEELHLSNANDIRLTMDSLINHESKVKIAFFGHTHIGATYSFHNNDIKTITDDLFALQPNKYYLINPGSIGQPRDGVKKLSYLTYDDTLNEVRFFRLDYDVKRCIKKAAKAGIWQPRWKRRLSNISRRFYNKLYRLLTFRKK